LTERRRIEDLLTDYAHCIDDDDLERWPGYFTETGLYRVIPRAGHEAGHRMGIMLCRGRGMMMDRVRAMRQANIYEPQRYTHLLGRSSVTAEDSTYSVRTNFQVVRTMEYGDSEMFVSGKYLDRVVVDCGEPRFAERHVILDSRRVDTLLVVPL
jgi:anthranilate 1,2-dioxygenase small subunit